MAKIQAVQQQVAAPSQLGSPRANTGMFEPIAQGMDALNNARLELEKRDAFAKIADAKSALRKRSMEQMVSNSSDRQGQAALPSDDGELGVFGQYEQDSTKWVGEYVNSIPPAYQNIARAELQGVADGYLEQSAKYEASQLEVFRDNSIKKSIASLNTELGLKMTQPDASIQDVFKAIEEMRVDVQLNSGGQDKSAFIEEQASALAGKAILMRAEDQPAAALQMLKDSGDIFKGKPLEREKLEKAIDQKRIEVGTDDLLASIADLPKEAALEIISNEKDPDIMKAAGAEFNYRNSLKDKAMAEAVEDVSLKFYQRITEGEEISTTDIRKDPTLTEAKDYQRMEQLIGLMQRGAEGKKMPAFEKHKRLYDTEKAIYSGEITSIGQLYAGAGTMFDDADLGKVIDTFNDHITGGGDYGDVNGEVNRMFSSASAGEKAGIQAAARAALRDARAQNKGEAIPYDRMRQIVKDAGTDLIESSFYWGDDPYVDTWQDKYPDIDNMTPGELFDSDVKKPTIQEQQLIRYQNEGYEGAYFDEAGDAFILDINSDPIVGRKPGTNKEMIIPRDSEYGQYLIKKGS